MQYDTWTEFVGTVEEISHGGQDITVSLDVNGMLVKFSENITTPSGQKLKEEVNDIVEGRKIGILVTDTSQVYYVRVIR